MSQREGYRSIAADIEAQIRGGELHPGDRLFSRNKLAVLYDVNPSTVWRALLLLQERGLIIGHQGGANVVAPVECWRRVGP